MSQAPVGDAGGAGNDQERFLAAARSMSQRVVQTGEGIFIEDLSRQADLAAESAATEIGLAAYASVPVGERGGRAVGAVCVGDVRRRRWTPAQRGLLEEVADLAAMAVELWVAEQEAPKTRARLAQYEQAVTRANDVVWSLRVLPGRRAEVVYYSPNVRAVVDPALMVGAMRIEDFGALVVPEDAQRAHDHLERLLAGEPGEVEVRIIDPQGRLRWVWSRTHPRWEGDELYCDGITTEITERKRVEEMRTQFLVIAGHELRTPLSVIRGYAEVVSSQVVDLPVVQRQVAAIERRAEELERLVGDFFDLAKLGSDQFELAVAQVRIDLLVQEAVADHAALATEGEVELAQIRAPLAPLTLLADPVRVRQVLDNLLSNAVRHTPAGGEVRVTCGLRDGVVRLGIENDGPEVAEDDIPRLFERFYRGRSRGDDGDPGTGLGLAVVRAIAEAHGGEAQAHRLPGRGMCFEVLLPHGGSGTRGGPA